MRFRRGSAAAPEQDECRESPALPPVGVFEFFEYRARVNEEPLHVTLVERGDGVVVGLMPLVLQGDEEVGKIPHLDGERTDVAPAASLLGLAVVQRAVDADPGGLSAHVPADELIGATLRQTVEQRVVGGADRAPKVGLERSAAAIGNEVASRGEEVRRSQA